MKRSSHVDGAEVELRTVTFYDGGAASALVFRQCVHVGFEIGICGDGPRCGEHHAAGEIRFLGAAKEDAHVIAGLSFVEKLAEHLDASDQERSGFAKADAFNGIGYVDDAALNAPGNNGAAPGNDEYVFNG